VAHLGGAPDLQPWIACSRRVGALGWHVVLHLDAEDILTYRDFWSACACRSSSDHMAASSGRGLDQAPFRLLLDVMKNERAWVKVSGPDGLPLQGSPSTTRSRLPAR